jgi:methyl-accepting chemotaxis protein
MAATYRRRNYLTNKAFQTRFIIPFILATSLANIITVSLFIVLARNKIDSLLYSMRLPLTNAATLLSPAVFTASIVAIVAISLLFLWAARGMYQRIAGPLHQIGSGLRRISNGDLSTKITLRDKDEFKDFAGEINSMIRELNNRLTNIRNEVEALAKAAEALKTSQQTVEFRTAFDSLKKSTGSLREQMRAFKI